MTTFWVEISALDHGHGGPGWELGRCLWSPATDRVGNDRYRIMREPAAGDTVCHLIRRNDGRVLAGKSIVAGAAAIRNDAPPTPGVWANFQGYYRIPLTDFVPFDPAPSIDSIEASNADEIRADIFPLRPEHHPYVTYGPGFALRRECTLASSPIV